MVWINVRLMLLHSESMDKIQQFRVIITLYCFPGKNKLNTVKTLYNVTRYNRIFNIRHKIAGSRSVSIKIPSL